MLITGAARGIGAALAQRLTDRGAHVGLLGLEPDLLAATAARVGGAPWRECDVSKQEQVDQSVEELTTELGGLDIVVANAGIAAQLPIIGGDPEIFRRTMDVNVLGAYYTLRAAGPHISHHRGYALAVSSLAAAIHLPLMGAYSASKAAVEALADSMRIEVHASGAKVGVAYFAEIDTDMTSRGFGTEAASKLARVGPFTKVAPLEKAVSALERGISRRSRTIGAPGFVLPMLPVRPIAQRVVDFSMRRNLTEVLEIARREHAELTTPQPERAS